ncbi:hypothetical protein ABBQ32_003923 [Trebouxia sp. C0010 RCD-2024]
MARHRYTDRGKHTRFCAVSYQALQLWSIASGVGVLEPNKCRTLVLWWLAHAFGKKVHHTCCVLDPGTWARPAGHAQHALLSSHYDETHANGSCHVARQWEGGPVISAASMARHLQILEHGHWRMSSGSGSSDALTQRGTTHECKCKPAVHILEGMGGRAACREEQMRHERLPALQAELVEHRPHQPVELVLGPRQ